MSKEQIGYLSIDGTVVKSVSSLTLSYNKVWSTDSGRTATSKFVGSIVGVKKKLEVSWKYLTESEMRTISNKVDSKSTPFHTIKFYNVKTGALEEFSGYFGDSSYPIYGFDARGNVCITGINLSIIER